MGTFNNDKVRKLQSDYQNVVDHRQKLVSHRRLGLARRLTAFGIISAIVGYLMISTFLSQSAAYENKIMEREQLQSDLKEMKKEQGKLEEEIVKLNDDEYIAKIARRDYFLSEDNEIIFSVPEDSGSYWHFKFWLGIMETIWFMIYYKEEQFFYVNWSRQQGTR